MITSLDQISRNTVGRFGVKLFVSAIISLVGKAVYINVLVKWLLLYAILTALIALMFKQRFPTYSFNHWDEALWLATAALGLRFVAKVML